MENSLPGVLFSQMPIIHFLPYFLIGNNPEKGYEIPLYKTVKRSG